MVRRYAGDSRISKGDTPAKRCAAYFGGEISLSFVGFKRALTADIVCYFPLWFANSPRDTSFSEQTIHMELLVSAAPFSAMHGC